MTPGSWLGRPDPLAPACSVLVAVSCDVPVVLTNVDCSAPPLSFFQAPDTSSVYVATAETLPPGSVVKSVEDDGVGIGTPLLVSPVSERCVDSALLGTGVTVDSLVVRRPFSNVTP